MPPWYDDDDDGGFRRRRRRRRDSSSPSPRRDISPGYQPRGAQPPPLISGALPPGPPQSRLEFEPRGQLYDSTALQVPASDRRPRSVPPAAGGTLTAACRTRNSSPSSTAVTGRSRSPFDKARHALRDTFTDSSSGLGVGILGAIVGGLAAREVSDVAARRHKGGHHGGSDKARLVSTLVGATIGGLGANALERRLEDMRDNDRREQLAVEDKWHHDDRPVGGARPPNRGRRRGTAEDYYDVYNGYDYVYDRKISRPRSEDAFRPPRRLLQ